MAAEVHTRSSMK